MAQQMKNGSYRKGDVTFTFRDSDRYAVVNLPFCGKHKKPQDKISLAKRKLDWMKRWKEYRDSKILEDFIQHYK